MAALGDHGRVGQSLQVSTVLLVLVAVYHTRRLHFFVDELQHPHDEDSNREDIRLLSEAARGQLRSTVAVIMQLLLEILSFLAVELLVDPEACDFPPAVGGDVDVVGRDGQMCLFERVVDEENGFEKGIEVQFELELRV